MVNIPVCIECGLTTDSEGRLIVNTGSSVWPYACDEGNGASLYCGTDGILRAEPEKFTQFQQVFVTHIAASSEMNAAGLGTPMDTANDSALTGSLTVTNPSDCRAMTAVIEWGVRHAEGIINGVGLTNYQVGARLENSAAAILGDVHQHWRYNGQDASSIISFDSMGSTRKTSVTIAAGASETFTVFGYFILADYNGDSQLSQWISSMDILSFNS